VHGVSKSVRKRAGLTVLCIECIGGHFAGSGAERKRGGEMRERLIVRVLSFCGLQGEKKRVEERKKSEEKVTKEETRGSQGSVKRDNKL